MISDHSADANGCTEVVRASFTLAIFVSDLRSDGNERVDGWKHTPCRWVCCRKIELRVRRRIDPPYSAVSIIESARTWQPGGTSAHSPTSWRVCPCFPGWFVTIRPRTKLDRSGRGGSRGACAGPGVESLEGRELLTSFLGGLQPYAHEVASTISSAGDVDPYGVAVVPAGFPTGGKLAPGDILVSNFNNAENLQGTGSSIVAVTPGGQTSTFFQGSNGLGLDNALAVLKGGYVLVANVPTFDGTAATIQQGSLEILNDNGQVVRTLTSSTFLDGPWGMTVDDRGSEAFVFVSNVLNGTVSRLDLTVSPSGVTLKTEVQVASGFGALARPGCPGSGAQRAGVRWADGHALRGVERQQPDLCDPSCRAGQARQRYRLGRHQ